MNKPTQFLIIIFLLIISKSSFSQTFEECNSAFQNPENITTFPYSHNINIDPSWTMDTDYLPDGLSGDNSTGYWAFTVDETKNYNFSFVFIGGGVFPDIVSIGVSENCPISNTEEIFFGQLDDVETVIECNELSSGTTYIFVFAVDQGDEGMLTVIISENTPENDECSIENPNILTANSGTTKCADAEYNFCGMPTIEDHQVFYRYTNTTSSNVDLQIDISTNNSNGNPATDISMLALVDDCTSGTIFPGTSEADYCNILDVGIQEICCIEANETVIIVLGSPIESDGDFNISASEVTNSVTDNNDECSDALEITFFNTCEWETIFVSNENACPEDFIVSGGCDFDLDPTVWYSFTVPAESGDYTLEIQNIGDAFSYLTIFDSSNDCDNPSDPIFGASCITGDGPPTIFEPLIPGVTYFIAFGNPVPSNYTFEIKLNKLPNNDECINAETLVANISTSGTTRCATQEVPSYNSSACTDDEETNTVWYQYTVMASEKGFNISITGAATNPIFGDINIVVFDGFDCNATEAVDEVCTMSTTINEEFECVGPGNYLIRVSTNDLESGDFDILIEPQLLIQPNEYCNAPDVSDFAGALENQWMNATANTVDACPESFDLPVDCGFDDYPVVWFEAISHPNSNALDIMLISASSGTPFIAVFEYTEDCTNPTLLFGSSCYSGIFDNLVALGEMQIEVNPSTTYLIGIGSDSFSGGLIDFGIKWITSGVECPNGQFVGDPCDDEDACTIDDTINEDCDCIGTFQDSDNDGTCDAEDVCEGGPEPGTACDDGDICTIEDVINSDCNCIGVFQDSDNDGTCDAEDICEDGPEPGTACDDEDACTIDDAINEDCICVGIFQDTDNDGTCDAEDICEDGPEPGTDCDDEDACTIEDTINADCQCVGIFQDSDNDGTCDAEDICEDGPEPGTLCDDENDCTINDMINTDCLCIGDFQDSDFDGTCDAEDVCDGGPEPGTACDDGDACTIDDVINEDCICLGIFQDTDEDGVCDAEDICENGPEPGTNCNDENETTFNDQITLDCICEGTTDSLYCPGLDLNIGDGCDDGDVCTTDDIVNEECECIGTFIDSDGDGTCDADDLCPNGPEPGTLCDDNNSETQNDQINMDCICEGSVDSTYCIDLEAYIGDSCNDNDTCTINDIIDIECNCVGEFQDSDGDGVCDAEDVCEGGPEPGTPCDDLDENTTNDQINENCECVGESDSNYCVELDLFIGDPCDDGDICTVADSVSVDCICLGQYQDSDNDNVCNAEDNCPGVANEDQLDNDNDGIGDECDTDDDNDGVLDVEDNCPFIENEDQTDSDMDGIGDACDINSTNNINFLNINFYPNPTRADLFFDSDDKITFRIIDINGILILQSESINQRIDVSDLQTGLYFIEYFNKDHVFGFDKILKI